MKKLWNFISWAINPNHGNYPEWEALDEKHITSWPVLPKGVKPGKLTFRKFKN